jgi:hypothetical protein
MLEASGRERRSDNRETKMLIDSYRSVNPASEAGRAYLWSLISADFERCHPGETFEDVKRRASFSKEDKGLLRDWMALAAMRAAADRAMKPSAIAA